MNIVKFIYAGHLMLYMAEPIDLEGKAADTREILLAAAGLREIAYAANTPPLYRAADTFVGEAARAFTEALFAARRAALAQEVSISGPKYSGQDPQPAYCGIDLQA